MIFPSVKKNLDNMKKENATTLIKEMLAKQAKAIQEQNVLEATKNYAVDVLIYDVVGSGFFPFIKSCKRDLEEGRFIRYVLERDVELGKKRRRMENRTRSQFSAI
jgi:hypothetical protein